LRLYSKDKLKMKGILKINEPIIGDEEIEAVTTVLKSGNLTERSGFGPYVLEFERKFAKFVDTKYAIAMNSGTSSIHAALLAAGVGPGDDVLVPSFTFSSTASSVLLTGARPIFADIDPRTYCINIDTINDAITERTRVIIPVHLYGMPADLDPIIEIARSHDVVIIEDAAQAHGALYKDRKIGSIGDMTCFSFYAGKNMTTGEGGMVTTNDETYAETLRTIRIHGEERPYWVTRVGLNYRMTEIAASIGICQLAKLPEFLKKRGENANELLKKLSNMEKLILPIQLDDREHAWNVFTVRLEGKYARRRIKILQKLFSKQIYATVYYETPVHLLPLYHKITKVSLPETEKASREVFSLPVHPKIDFKDLTYIANTLKSIL
jgi:dTDP-4-amino-4,6-dideoxygalactose transaminase